MKKIFNFFKPISKKISVHNPDPFEFFTETEIIKLLHDEIDNASTFLLQEANKILGKGREFNMDKIYRLQRVGFSQSYEVIEGIKEDKIFVKTKEDAELIEYYSKNYPNNKFIRDEQLSKICNRFGLVICNVNKYTGIVPDKNLKEIEEFELRDEDYTYEQYDKDSYNYHHRRKVSYYEYLKYEKKINDTTKLSYLDTRIDKIKHPLEICAPLSQVKIDENEIVENCRILIKEDPIVIQQVDGGYLILTKW